MDITPHKSLPPAGAYRMTLVDGHLRAIDANGKQYRLRPEAGTPVHAVAATNVFTATALAAGETTTIGGVTYTFTDVAPAVAYEVLIEVAVDDTLANLSAAINGGAGAGTKYGTGTVAHPDVTGTPAVGQVTVTARVSGVSGNLIAVATDGADCGWDTSEYLTNGVGATVGTKGDQLIDGSFLYTATADVTETSTSGWEKSAVAAV